MTLTLRFDLGVIQVHTLTKFWIDTCYNSWDMTFCLVTFCLVWILVQSQTYGQTECDAYEPTVHTHRWAQIYQSCQELLQAKVTAPPWISKCVAQCPRSVAQCPRHVAQYPRCVAKYPKCAAQCPRWLAQYPRCVAQCPMCVVQYPICVAQHNSIAQCT